MVISPTQKLKQEDSEFKANLSNLVQLYFKLNKKKGGGIREKAGDTAQ